MRTTTEVNQENLSELISFLEKMPEKAFGLDIWYNWKGRGAATDPKLAIDVVRRQSESNGEHVCGTVACIAGWIDILESSKHKTPRDLGGESPSLFVKYRAANWLGLNGADASGLFMPGELGEPSNPYEIPIWHADVTKDQAITVLRHLQETGKVDWSVVEWPAVKAPASLTAPALSIRAETSE